MNRIPRRHFLALASAAAMTPFLPPIRQARAIPVLSGPILSLFFITRGLYDTFVAKPQERQTFLKINQDLVAVGDLNKQILDELEGLGIFVRKELEKQFKEKDITEVDALERKLSSFQVANRMNVAAGMDREEMQDAARRANLVTSRLGQYEDYAAFPPFLRAAWLQMYFASLNEFTPVQLREIIRQQQRACSGWANIQTTASLNIEAVKQPNGFLVKRHYDFTSAPDESRQMLPAGSVILSIDGTRTKDLSDATFANMLSGPLATKVSLLVQPPAGDVYTFIAEREFAARDLPEPAKRTLLERDISARLAELQGRTKDLEGQTRWTFQIAEHVRWVKYTTSYQFDSTRISAEMQIDIENGQVEVKLQERDINDMCTGNDSKGKCVAANKYRVSGDGTGDVSYLSVAASADPKTGCLVSSDEKTSYSIDYVRKYADEKKACLQTHYTTLLQDRQTLIEKIGRTMEIKMSVALMAQHLHGLDLTMQKLVDLGYGTVPYIACANAVSDQKTSPGQCIPKNAL